MPDDEIDFSEIKSQIRQGWEKAQKDRFKVLSNGYRWDRWIGTCIILTIFAFLWFVAHSHGYSLDYYKCGTMDVPDHMGYTGEDMCRNPFYKPVSWKNQEFLPPGEYGTKLGPLFESIFYAPFLIFGLAGFLNHIIHNRRRKK